MGGQWSGCLRMIATASWVLAAVTGANALDYPNRNIRVVVPFAAAGVTDIVARVVFERVSRAVGQTIVIDNRPGAGGTVGVDHVVNSPADGYTLVMADPSGSLPVNVTLYPTLKYHPVKDLTPIAIFGTTGAVLLVNNELPIKSAPELVALAKAKPGELTFASTGVGTPGHLNGELFSRLAGIKAVHVPYRVVGQAVADLVAARISFWIAPIPTMLQQVRQGQLRPLAVAVGSQRGGA
jgi:tripartite-type tricarboxylate transporter receptor subunit TctC